MLEVASELVAGPDWPQKQARISLRDQGGGGELFSLHASDAPGSVDDVMSGEAQIGIVNPSAVLAMAYHGSGPFKEPLPVRTITVLPQVDQLGLAVAKSTGLTTVRELVERRYPLKVSLRGQRDHSVHLVTGEVFAALGCSVDDIASWGGQVRYDAGLPPGPNRIGAFERGEIDAIFDEALPTFGKRALELGMRFLAFDEDHLQQLEKRGLRRLAITGQEYPGLDKDVQSLDFSGWPVFCRADLADDAVTAFCTALEARKDRIPSYGGPGPLRLDRMCRDTPEGPLPVPLHPAAERFWRARGYLS
ncbi:MAG TPA: TAXI family TRAP transporter solute-binding subunit [Methylomirabilota bacterium]|nr:TAXI family TRAP transporter solute-binding subunit [Methylomirabilota bacterium]